MYVVSRIFSWECSRSCLHLYFMPDHTNIAVPPPLLCFLLFDRNSYPGILTSFQCIHWEKFCTAVWYLRLCSFLGGSLASFLDPADVPINCVYLTVVLLDSYCFCSGSCTGPSQYNHICHSIDYHVRCLAQEVALSYQWTSYFFQVDTLSWFMILGIQAEIHIWWCNDDSFEMCIDDFH